MTNPVADWEVWKDGASAYTAYQFGSDQFSYPILITSYSAGDVYKVRAAYTWFNSPSPDYTVKIYSKQTLQVKSSTSTTNMIHMDGSSPSGFTNSTYKGMDNTDWKPVVAPPADTEVNSFGDMIAAARDKGNFFLIRLFTRCFFINPFICFFPWNWVDKDE